MGRINQHPILEFVRGEKVRFTFSGQTLEGYAGEPIAAALHAAGIKVLSHSSNLGRPRGFFCAVGNCSSCLMKVNGIPNVRVCVEPLQEGMRVELQRGKEKPALMKERTYTEENGQQIQEIELAVVGGGPAGLHAAIAAAQQGAEVILLEQLQELGGQLVKQTHKFFGSEDQRAGVRGVDIARELTAQVAELPNINVWTGTTALGYYEDNLLLVEKDNLIQELKPKKIVVAAGAFERSCLFPNNDLPGIYGAGAVQTLMNEHGIFPGERVIMVGAGNIGLIVSYQLLQAGVEVAAIVEATASVGGYEVHAAKIRRAGVPIYTKHIIKNVYGAECVEGACIIQVDEQWHPVTGTEKSIRADVMCIAVGLSPLVELLWQAGCRMSFIPELGGYVPVIDQLGRTSVPGIYVAGDAAGIEEASSAMLTGRLAGLTAAIDLGYEKDCERQYKKCQKDLESLRSGPAGEKIRCGLHKLMCKENGENV